MKQRKALLVCGMVVTALLALGVGTAFAIPLTNTPISNLEFFLGGCGPAAGSLTTMFDFEPFGAGDGTVTSEVYAGCAAGGTSGQWFYRYQVSHFTMPPSSEQMIHAISMDWQALTPWFARTSFFILDAGGTNPPSDAHMNPDFASGTLTFDFDHLVTHIEPGQTSMWFGAVSMAPPGTVFANLIDSGREDEAQVLVPIPEPASLLLLSSGLMGLAGFKASRRRKVKAIAVA